MVKPAELMLEQVNVVAEALATVHIRPFISVMPEMRANTTVSPFENVFAAVTTTGLALVTAVTVADLAVRVRVRPKNCPAAAVGTAA